MAGRRIGIRQVRDVMEVVVTPKKTNQRDLRRKRPPPRDRQMPLHLAENNPPPASKEAVPINRRAARARASEDSPKDD